MNAMRFAVKMVRRHFCLAQSQSWWCAGLPRIHPIRYAASEAANGHHDSSSEGGARDSQSQRSSSPVDEVEMKNATMMFDIAWENLVKKFGEENLVFPKDIMWLCGAPGSGKGCMTKFIQTLRQITCEPIETSSVLSGNEVEKIKAAGGLVPDRLVLELLIEKLLVPKYDSGVIVDGFPRTRSQGHFISLLFDKMRQLRVKYEGTEHGHKFRRPVFHITVLFVEENVSIERQLMRGRQVIQHNKIAKDAGVGSVLPIRPTDVDVNLARHRYRQFKEHVYDSLQVVKSKFHFHFINANGDPHDVEKRIRKELEYQSSLELAHDTFEMVRRLPLASEIIEGARHLMVKRLDNYCRYNSDLFTQVIALLEKDFFNILRRQALLGRAIIRSDDAIWSQPLALDMALDLLTERGFSAAVDYQRTQIPASIDPITHEIVHVKSSVKVFDIRFPKPQIRNAG